MVAEFAALFPFIGLERRVMTLTGCMCVLQFTLLVQVRRF
jgi:hypothetical protein